MHFLNIINCSFLMHWTWLKAAVVKIQIKKNGQGLKGICGWIKVDKWYFHTYMYTLCVKIGSTYNMKGSNTKKFTHFEFFSKSHIIIWTLKVIHEYAINSYFCLHVNVHKYFNNSLFFIFINLKFSF